LLAITSVSCNNICDDMAGLKALVAVLVVLVIAAIIVSPNGIDKAGNFTDTLKGFLDSALGKLTSSGGPISTITGTKSVSLSVGPSELSLVPDAPLNITSGSTHINGFSGTINISGSGVALSEKATGLELSLPANGTELSGLKINALSLSGVPFYISPNITTTGGNITIAGFYGSGSISSGRLSLDGNVSRVRASIGDVSVEV